MSVTRPVDSVSIWWENGLPACLLWQGKRYRVTDTPTVLGEEFFGLTHLPARMSPPGWRLQGTTEDGGSHMFEIRMAEQTWLVTRAYD